MKNSHTKTTLARDNKSKLKSFRDGALAVSPLCIAVVPWGLLAGSYAIEVGLDIVQSQAMSAIVFAGAAQLVATGLINAGSGITTILLTTAFITSRHLLYSLTMRNKVSLLPLRWRLTLGFLLTDELFAVCGHQSPKVFDRWYALGAGLWFYICWNISSFIGIIGGKFIPNLDSLGLDFAIAATFIAIVIPTIKSMSVFISVIVAILLSVTLQVFNIDGSLIIASLGAMVSGYGYERLFSDKTKVTGGKV